MDNYSNYCLIRTKEALQLAQNLSEYVRSLPLTNEQNDKLVSMMADCTQKFESDAFTLGLSWSAGRKGIAVSNHTTRKEQTHEKQHRCIQV